MATMSTGIAARVRLHVEEQRIRCSICHVAGAAPGEKMGVLKGLRFASARSRRESRPAA